MAYLANSTLSKCYLKMIINHCSQLLQVVRNIFQMIPGIRFKRKWSRNLFFNTIKRQQSITLLNLGFSLILSSPLILSVVKHSSFKSHSLLERDKKEKSITYNHSQNMRLTLVFMWNRALREGFNFCFSRAFAWINKIFLLAGRLGTRPSFYKVYTLSWYSLIS